MAGFSLFTRYFATPEVMWLLVTFLAFTGVFWLVGDYIVPVLIALGFAYLMQVPRDFLLARGWSPNMTAGILTGLLTLGFLALAGLALPLVYEQTRTLIAGLPIAIEQFGTTINSLLVSWGATGDVDLTDAMQIADFPLLDSANPGQSLVSVSLSTLPRLLEVLFYIFIEPVVLFFAIRDSHLLGRELRDNWLPNRAGLIVDVLKVFDQKMIAYVNGKSLEGLIVGLASYVLFLVAELPYTELLTFLTALSVTVPYLGMALAVMLVGGVTYQEYGFGIAFQAVCGIYAVIHFIDGHILVPLLFSDQVNLHPLSILAAILAFGGLWGFWGVFFAIPIALFLKAVFMAWPSYWVADDEADKEAAEEESNETVPEAPEVAEVSEA